MSGDGLIHEVLNGFAKHADPIRAFRTPVAPIPTGSGNGTALNLLGLQGDNRVVSYMSQAIGLMAELDLGTEHLRFMGDKYEFTRAFTLISLPISIPRRRFMYGFLRGVVQHRSCPVKVSIKVVESNKRKMISDLHNARSEATNRIKSLYRQPLQDVATDGGPKDTPSHESTTAAHTSSLPPLVHRDQPQGEGWIVFDKRFMFLYAGKGPFVSRDLMQFPVSHPDDGYIDVVIQEQTTRKGMLQGIDGAETGKNYWLETQHYFKAEAYRVEPHASDSYLSVDGERYPFEPFQVEVHKGLATLLSPYGSYNAEFSLPE
ncbi:hypothetical protein PHLCEN_2v10082 [Hermanssonia centrifuga]|uniref:DAGKc domain-containing protein n=1 Tax=Hermanssonia centrifuga TaxID=98765 RepID=A0A2R6NNW2_9APHY|nr:hypothetical protein PHLCEN_2v10082 [Hermanssonia centrifuga]